MCRGDAALRSVDVSAIRTIFGFETCSALSAAAGKATSRGPAMRPFDPVTNNVFIFSPIEPDIREPCYHSDRGSMEESGSSEEALAPEIDIGSLLFQREGKNRFQKVHVDNPPRFHACRLLISSMLRTERSYPPIQPATEPQSCAKGNVGGTTCRPSRLLTS